MDDRRLELIIGNLLRAGVLLAAAVVLIGGVLYLAGHNGDRIGYRQFSPGGPAIQSVAGILQSASHLDSEGLIQLGLLLLIATPVARVALAIVIFAVQRDRLYVVVTILVLAILLYSLTSAQT